MSISISAVSVLLACASQISTRAQSASPQPAPSATSAVERLLDEFSHAPLVGVAEHHRSRQVHEFLLALLAHPKFSACVDDIVVEFGSAHYQPVIDRYIAGEAVPIEELREVWRGTTQWLVWDSPLYARFFEAVRSMNASLPKEHRVRVLLGDPPIHWANVTNAAEYRAFAERDAFYAEVVEREVLAKNHRALLIVGGMHLPRRGPTDPSVAKLGAGVGELLSQHHPESLFVVWTLPPSPELAERFGISSAPTFVRLASSALGKQSFGLLTPRGVQVQRVVNGESQWTPMGEIAWPPMSDVVDAVLYLGNDGTTVDPDPSIYADAQYESELRRRARILQDVYGMDFLPELEGLLRSKSGQ